MEEELDSDDFEEEIVKPKKKRPLLDKYSDDEEDILGLEDELEEEDEE